MTEFLCGSRHGVDWAEGYVGTRQFGKVWPIPELGEIRVISTRILTN